MAMSTGGGGEDTPMSDINTTPLVDVMLVLLIVFLIAIPVAIQTVKMQLPEQIFEPTKAKRENVLLSVTTTDVNGLDPGADGFQGANPGGECRIYWNVTPVDSTELVDRAAKHLKREFDILGGPAAAAAGQITPDMLPEAHIRGDVNTPYRCIGGAIYSMQMAGFARVGFISTPFPPLDSAK
ncbi:Biopolymer transport protein ExbD/TolR [Sphingomonadaceae bacterium]|jgi:biopolymer transport protein ExbD|nr:biopolymer transporter ExbD [Sphingorhabdus sp.]